MSHFIANSCHDLNFVAQELPDHVSYSQSMTRTRTDGSREWNSQTRPPSAQPSLQSLVTPVKSTETAPGHQEYFDGSDFIQDRAASFNHRPRTGLLDVDMLAPPRQALRTSSPMPPNSHEEAWNIFNLRAKGAATDPKPPEHNRGNLTPWVLGPGSVGSAVPMSDSGHNSQSAISHDLGHISYSTSHVEFAQHFEDSRVQSTVDDIAIPMIRLPSDLKKHRIKHSKAFMCEVPSCKRKGKGFRTTNDLDRHKKSVHKIGLLQRSFQCAARTCKNKSKIWPRLDNFKQHVSRMHKGEDHIELIKKSSLMPGFPTPVTEVVSVGLMDNMVAGMEKSLSDHIGFESVLSTHTRADSLSTHRHPNLRPNHDHFHFHQHPTALHSSMSMRDQAKHVMQLGNMQFWTEQNHQNHQQQQCSMHRTEFSTSAAISDKANFAPYLTEQQEKLPVEISSAPHTKAQQQQLHSLQKHRTLSKPLQAVAHDLKDSTNIVYLERVLLQILSGSSEPSDDDKHDGSSPSSRPSTVCITKSEAIKAAQMLTSIIKQSPESAYSQSRKGIQDFSIDNVVCPQCGYAVARPCDLKKHIKRHEKPYGCTYPNCYKRFGAKSDWKRHENSQHFQPEAFWCAQMSTVIANAECGEHFLRVEHFEKHLDTWHKMSSEDAINEEIKRSQIGKNCQGQFWCGFEKRIIELKEKRNAAWDERFDHIAWHFEKEGKRIDDWVCVEANKKKGQLLREMDRHVLDEGDEEDGRGEQGSARHTCFGPELMTSTTILPAIGQGNLWERSAPADLSAPPKPLRHEPRRGMYHDAPTMARQEDTRYCCQCHDGPYSIRVAAACITCGHAYSRCCIND